ncbi:MAG: Type 1 glutamine amidotransferase-like domain-containing protein [Blautia sp.]|nr:Type 1 glutamine amidotransferase-like domain-containing protein [Blautia sp.]MCM1201056.1 Type 1 glutamine amidotransferase-like domain-containing protein [Bacteroides fragilis]
MQIWQVKICLPSKELFIPTAAIDAYAIEDLCGGNTHYLLERINATGFRKSLTEHINNNGLVIGVSAGSLIFPNNLGLTDTKSDVHCATGEKRGKLVYPSAKKQCKTYKYMCACNTGFPKWYGNNW